ncbi:MAG TPA: hypothetical protein VN207_08415 [Ktedonobacteraceae bacterium]|nr:hypothetical protein [Ktedonobacteraceae bacterium]
MENSFYKDEKRFSVDLATLCIYLVLFLAVLLRLILIHSNWPLINSDEATIDLMALHIAYRGEHPLVFYGQDYMGTLQAYLGAILIRLFGISIFSVRLGIVLIFALFLVSMYYLVRLLYTQHFALFVIALLSIGSDRMFGVLLVANGGYAETMLLGALIFLLASWLALTSQQGTASKRVVVYACLGCLIGLALWSQQIILPCILFSGLLLLLFCRRDIHTRALPALIVGFFVGIMPLILYNIYAVPGHDSLHALVGNVFPRTPRTLPLSQHIIQTLLITLPLATGFPSTINTHPICNTVEPYLQPLHNLNDLFPFSDHPWLCVASHGAWSLGITIVWCVSIIIVITLIRSKRERWLDVSTIERPVEEQQQLILQYARLMLIVSGALWLLLFTISSAAAVTPRSSTRYLVCLLFSAPALLWPLWQGISEVKIRLKQRTKHARKRFILKSLILSCIVVLYIQGTLETFERIPEAQTTYAQREALIHDLLRIGATRIYSDYWTCNILIFQSNERVICSSLDNHLQPGLDRYLPYRALVHASPHPAYVFPRGFVLAQVLQKKQVTLGNQYRQTILDGYFTFYYGGTS